MEANMYDLPALAKFLNTYVPINFDLLYRVGAVLKQAIDLAVLDLSGKILKWSEFKSPSEIDTKRYYDKTIGALKGDIEYFASNPDALKTAEGRYRLQSKINNLDYSGLSQYKQNAENFNQRLKNIAKMKAEGTYKDSWDKINISKWDTELLGTMNELSPTLFKTMHDLGDPYAKNLKPTFYGKVNPNTGEKKAFTDWSAITFKDIARLFLNPQVLRDIINTPQGAKHYEDIALQMQKANPNVTLQEVLSVFSDELTRSQGDKLIANPISDDLGFRMWARLLDKEEAWPSTTLPLTEQMSILGNKRWEGAKILAFANTNPIFYNAKSAEYTDAVQRGDSATAEKILKEIATLASKLGQKDIINQMIANNEGMVTGKTLKEGIRTFLNTFVNPIQSSRVSELLTGTIPGATGTSIKTQYGELTKVANIGGLVPLNNTVVEAAGRKLTEGSASKLFLSILLNNNISALHIGNLGYVTLNNAAHPTEGDNRLISTYLISKLDLLSAGISEAVLDNMVKQVGGNKVPKKDIVKMSYVYDSRGELDRSTQSVNTEDEYYLVPLSSQVPYTSDILSGSDLLNAYDKVTTGTKGQGASYPSRQSQSLEVDDSNLNWGN